MPYINLKLVGKLSKDQKEKIAKEFSDTLLKVNGENWAKGDKFFG